MVDAVIEEAAAVIAVAIVVAEAGVQVAIVEVAAEAVVEETAEAEETVGVASGAVASGLRTGRDRPWARAQDRSRARTRLTNLKRPQRTGGVFIYASEPCRLSVR